MGLLIALADGATRAGFPLNLRFGPQPIFHDITLHAGLCAEQPAIGNTLTFRDREQLGPCAKHSISAGRGAPTIPIVNVLSRAPAGPLACRAGREQCWQGILE
jgi:hypothetical protein